MNPGGVIAEDAKAAGFCAALGGLDFGAAVVAADA
jgi:hypothetical protein